MNPQRHDDVAQLRTLNEDVFQNIKPELPEFDLSQGRRTDPFKEQLDRTAASQAADDTIVPDLNRFREGLGDTGVERLLREARDHIEQKDYEAAEASVAQALETDPQCPDAIYLQGLIQFRTEHPRRAMRTLQPLRGHPLAEGIATSVDALWAAIRSVLSREAVAKHLMWMLTDRFDEAAEYARELVELDPEAGLFRYMLAGDLMKAGKLDDAVAVAREAASVGSPQERRQLAQLTDLCLRQRALARMEPARAAYRAGNCRAARRRLGELDPDSRSTPLYRVFDRYLQRLDGKRFGVFGRARRPADVAPKGSRSDVDELHEFLVEEDFALAMRCMERGDFREMKQAVGNGLRHAPHYGLFKFMYAGLIFRVLMESLRDPRTRPSVDTAIAELNAARAHARQAAGMGDREQRQLLVEAIGKVLSQFEQARRKNAAREAEARPINEAIQEFGSIMESAQGIESARQRDDIRRRLKALKQRVTRVAKGARSEEAQKAVRELGEAVDSNLSQIAEADRRAAEAGPINEVIQQFGSIMKSAERIESARQRDGRRHRLEALRQRVYRVARGARSEEAQKAVRELGEAIGRHLGQFAEVNRRDRFTPLVNELIARFKTLTEGLSRTGGITSMEQLGTVLREFSALQTDTQNAMREVRDGAGREQLEQLQTDVNDALAALTRR